MPSRSRQSGAIAASGSRTKLRLRARGWGTVRPPRTESPAAPQHDVEIEHARAPAAAAAPAEFAFDLLEPLEQFRRIELAFDQRHRIGEIAPGAAVRGVEHDRRGIEQAEVAVEPRDRRLDHAGRPAMASVRPVRADRDGVELGQQPTPWSVVKRVSKPSVPGCETSSPKLQDERGGMPRACQPPRRTIAGPGGRSTARLPACARGWWRSASNAASSIPDWWNAPVPAFGDRNAWLAIVGLAPGKQGANRTGRPFTGDYAGELLYATLLKFGLAEGEYRADPSDSLRLTGAIILNAVKCLPPANKPEPREIATCRSYFEVGARRAAESPRGRRARPDRPRGRCAGDGPAAGCDQVRPRCRAAAARRPHPARRAITARAITRTQAGSTRACSKGVQQAVERGAMAGEPESLYIHEPLAGASSGTITTGC